MGAGGIKIRVTNMSHPHTTNTIIRNNTITDIGNENPCGAGILVLNASNSTITHNEISYTYYTGISCGWTWGYNNESRTNPCTGNIISYNYIHHIGRGMLSDLGGIYTLGEQPGTVIENNVIHDVQSYDYGGIGIYTDEGSSHITIRNNLVYRCSDAGYEHNYGRDNIIENNIFAFNGKWQLLWVNQEPTVPFTFRRNIIIHDSGTTLNGCMSWREGNAKMSHNLYWHTGGRLDFASLNFSTWRNRHDRGSVEADPLFVNARGGDFRFRSTAAARRIDFKPFDYSLAGVYGPMKSTVHSSQPSAPQPSTPGTIHFPF
jgi:parallel beta-helix repeat protein